MLQLFGRRSRADLPSIVFNDDGKQRVLFTLPPTRRPDRPSALVFAMPKSGSTLLDRIMRRLSRHVGLRYVSVMGTFFKLGVPDKDMPAETSRIFLPHGYCYGGFRYLPGFDIPILGAARSVLLVRDPRDMLVSHYYSMRESHVEPGRSLKSTSLTLPQRETARSVDIDDYVKGPVAEHFRTCLTRYRTMLCASYDVKLYRYEDVIYDKANWVADLANHFGWEIPRWRTDSIARRFDIIPRHEETAEHIRQVHPGNYRKKLAPETVAWLNGFLREEMEYFGYATNEATGSDGAMPRQGRRDLG